MPFPENTSSLEDMLNMPTGELAQMPVELLACLQAELTQAARQLKTATARFHTALDVRYATRATEARRACGKDTGTVRLVDGEYTVVADLPKRVDWDQAQLAAMVERIRAAGDDPAQYVDIAFKVPERKYAAWPDAIRAGFEPARTVKTGTLKVALEPNETAQ
ncbi:hypothetical protein JSE7799_01624 [Jannaschia seosinensis]|uniref:Uncharacterized protein n=2 Tax=Jannaschia seosinensis TaxID=313367 RepID=A0A0M7BC42_9RHOB|nr:hypothetical protein JSE7799_01624 [Jannaschia seosinensis]